MKDCTSGKLQQELAFAESIRDDSLKNCLARLQSVDENCNTETSIYPDFAPHSFEFARFKGQEFRGNGGIIFHGAHDGFGSGSAPTFSVCLTPTKGWAIHT